MMMILVYISLPHFHCRRRSVYFLQPNIIINNHLSYRKIFTFAVLDHFYTIGCKRTYYVEILNTLHLSTTFQIRLRNDMRLKLKLSFIFIFFSPGYKAMPGMACCNSYYMSGLGSQRWCPVWLQMKWERVYLFFFHEELWGIWSSVAALCEWGLWVENVGVNCWGLSGYILDDNSYCNDCMNVYIIWSTLNDNLLRR